MKENNKLSKKNNEIQKNPYPYGKIEFKPIQYKVLAKKMDKLKKDFKFFINKNKSYKRIKTRNTTLDTQMTRILSRLATQKEDNSHLIKSLNMNIKGKNKRFMSAKEIERFREKKSFLLKMISLNNEKDKNNSGTNLYMHSRNQKIKFPIHKFNATNKLGNSLIGLKKNKNKNTNEEFRTSFGNKSIENIPLIKSFIFKDNKTNNKSWKKFVNQKLISRDGIINQKHFSLFQPKSTKNINITNLLLDNIKVEDNSEIKEEPKIKEKNSKKELSNISLDINMDNNKTVTYDDKIKIKRKIYLKKLNSTVEKFEHSKSYYPDNDIIKTKLKDPFTFFKTKNMSQLESTFFNKGKKRRINLMKNNIIPKISLVNTLTPAKTEKNKLISKSKEKTYNSKVIIKKLNIIKNRANNKKMNIKTMYKNNNKYINKLVNYFSFDEAKIINKSMGRDIKKDAIKYKKGLGNFVYFEGKFFFATHLSHIRKGEVKYK